jgi:V/A-type H+/Na+-transporting ATPase subunit I
MTKVAILGLKQHREKTISILQEMSAVQIEPLSADTAPYLETERESAHHRQISEQLLRIRGLLNALPQTKLDDKTRFSSLDDLFTRLNQINIDSQISLLEHKRDNLLTRKKETENNIKLLEEFSFFPEDLELLHLSLGV